jgi:hypothetical protein
MHGGKAEIEIAKQFPAERHLKNEDGSFFMLALQAREKTWGRRFKSSRPDQ